MATTGSEICNEAEIHERMSKAVNSLHEATQKPAGLCQLILQESKWDPNVAALKLYSDKPNAELCGSYDPKNPADDDASKKYSTPAGYCECCAGDNVPLQSLNCGHSYCRTCWSSYIKGKVIDEITHQIRCPATKCNVLLDKRLALQLNTDPEVKSRFENLEMRHFLMCTKFKMKPCLGVGCTKYAVFDYNKPSPRMECTCGYLFCAECEKAWHEPVSCELLAHWLKRCSTDQQNLKWIRAFTKDCPRCKTPIEKNQGCNHMTCGPCKYEFCWICMGDWKRHGGQAYNCSFFQGDKNKKAAEEVKADLDQFLRYAEHYENHLRSIQCEKQLRDNLAVKEQQFSKAFGGAGRTIETAFMRDAFKTLGLTRRILQHSYVFAYVLDRDNVATQLFEENQKKLEGTTEALAGLLENTEIEGKKKDELQKLKLEVMQLTVKLANETQHLLEHAKSGAKKNEWRFNDAIKGLKRGTMEFYTED